MIKKQLTQSVIKKIQMAKLLYDLGNDCFRISENPEKIGAGVILLQDSVEIFLIAICEHLGISLGDYVRFEEYFSKLKEKTSEEAPLKKQILTINRQRVNIKHLGLLPHIDDCKNFPEIVRTFFIELSNRYLDTDFDSITLVDLLDDSEQKEFLKQAEIYLKSGNYRECQINCRKALYLTFEKRFDIRRFEKEEHISLFGAALFSDAPFYTKNKKYIEENVNNPTHYISIDHDNLEEDLLLDGIMSIDFWNVWRLTPPMYYYEVEKEWVIKDEFKDEAYNEENAEYCFRKMVEILLLKQRRRGQTKYVKTRGAIIKTKNKKVKVFAKASLNSKTTFEFDDGPYEIYSHGKVRGLDDKRYYHNISHEIEKEGKKFYIFGYICEDDIEI